ncbi:NAD-dependent epimerase/dehydratase [Irpex rosettiformis]|uniref:NAD-dependent epimerase/dehydratase n=1 Tax=Irpex rosettiformis TaxID=378272 RepID=A0ACB8UDR7_9APHY|nr:NAD-dependent epimerase/dehydratase [Irpex rosettiformis]
MEQTKKALVTGGSGFIGSHVARELVRRGYSVRIIDIVGRDPSDGECDDDNIISGRIEFLRGNLLEPADCVHAVEGVDIVLHFAANMGGMGVIHEANDSVIYEENHRMTTNIFSAAKDAGVNQFFYASSACVYPSFAQTQCNGDVALREAAAYQGQLPAPQGLYGLEKLHSEEYLQLGMPHDMQLYIARFHNIYGPRGSWQDGREKAPAAILRKCLAAKISGVLEVELWGDGTQRRSFCFIDDAVEGVMRLIQSNCHVPVNIGSDRALSMRDFVDCAARAVGLDPSQLEVNVTEGRPTGVSSRNSDNTFIKGLFCGWAPSTPLEDGIRITGHWIESQMQQALCHLSPSQQEDMFRDWRSSKVVQLADNKLITFAVLLPVTSRTTGGGNTTACLESLACFAESLRKSIDHSPSSTFRTRVYLAIDDSDDILNPSDNSNPAAKVLHDAGIGDVVTLTCHLPPGRVCSLWRECARRAWEDGCDYYVLMGDDVVLPHEAQGWQALTHGHFKQLAEKRGVPHGFGCIAFTDLSFPGMPTFPIVHRTHMEVFGGQVIPDIFVNQDGDPYLFQLYRRFGCSIMMEATIRNILGGSEGARYEKLHAKDWTFGTLEEGTNKLESFLGPSTALIARVLTLDVIIPCYRVNMAYIDGFLSLPSPEDCHVMFVVIVDNPASPSIAELQEKYGGRWDVRIRVNKRNLGASASRNRGLMESAAEWVLFLDDDVVAERDILYTLVDSIRSHPTAAGFVGNSKFPVADSVFTAALHIAGVTYFWDIAEKMSNDHDIPWGVTANLAACRRLQDDVVFDLSFPKTGGGEDIDYCRKKRDFSIAHGGTGFVAAPKALVTHPYWNNGKRSYWRFYMWSKGDGALIKLYPHLVYLDYSPNSAELLLLSLFSTATVVAVTLAGNADCDSLTTLIIHGLRHSGSIILANVIHDAYRHLFRHPDRTKSINTTVVGIFWLFAVLESTFVRIFSEVGRVMGILERREFSYLLHRFDWFAGHPAFGDGPKREERRNSMERFGLCLLIATLGYCFL